MKKITCIVLLIFTQASMYSQNSKFELGPEVGLNITDYVFSGDDSDNRQFITRFSIGAIGRLDYAKNWSIKFKLRFDAKGAEENNGLFKERLNYATFSMTPEYVFGKGKLKGFMNFGLYGGVLLSAKLENENGEEINVDDNLESTDFGAAYGIGIIYCLENNKNLIFELNGQTGILDIGDSTGNSAAFIRNQIFGASIALTLGM